MKKIINIFHALLSYATPIDWPNGEVMLPVTWYPWKGLDFDFEPGEMNDDETVDMSTTKNIKWVAVGFTGLRKCYYSHGRVLQDQ